MEMNTRLQVEHPVTEMITGLDLVEWQLRVAAGQRLPLRQDQLTINGHAIEARIYAENPDKGFLPSIGSLHHVRTPQAVAFELGGGADAPARVRIDSGVREGDAISPFYDPMIAKLIVWGGNREQALARMAQALAEYQIVGLASNIAFLQRLIASAPFASADLDTGLIERHHDVLFPAPSKAALPVLALAAAALLCAEQRQHGGDPWSQRGGWRLNSELRRRLDFADDNHTYPLDITYRADAWTMEIDGVQTALRFADENGSRLALKLGEHTVHGDVVREGEAFHIFTGGGHAVLTYADPLAHAGEAEVEGGRLTAPMPGKVVAVLVSAGEAVEKGAPLLIMEAMKMEHTIAAPNKGVVDEVLYAVGDQVAEGAQLLSFRLDDKSKK
jgi:3-methylcrotonyl-CoA carboxylase alpha subunit